VSNAEHKATCELCGEQMPPGEEMFKYHGYSGPCPKPPKHTSAAERRDLEGIRLFYAEPPRSEYRGSVVSRDVAYLLSEIERLKNQQKKAASLLKEAWPSLSGQGQRQVLEAKGILEGQP